MRKLFKFKNKALSANGFHALRALNDKSENGRSMVEMLGVLAVIGVLSVGGIYGYKQAMAQHKANQIWSDVMLWATLIRGIPDYNVGWHNRDVVVDFDGMDQVMSSNYEVTGVISGINTAGAFQIYVSNVPKNVCERVVQLRPDEPVAIWPNGSHSASCSGENNTMRFIFDFQQMCGNLCEKWYAEWQGYCGPVPTNYWECDPTLGFYCMSPSYWEKENTYRCKAIVYKNTSSGRDWHEHQGQDIVFEPKS